MCRPRLKLKLKLAARNNQRGVALAIVVWFIAGMSLLVAGTVLSARTDARLAQVHLQRAKAAAAGDGAINLLLADVYEGRFNNAAGGQLVQAAYQLNEQEVVVTAVPINQLVELGDASPLALESLFLATGLGGATDAQALAVTVVQWRALERAQGVGGTGFEAIEDLMNVPGINRAFWDVLRDYVAVQPGGGTPGGARLDASLQWLRAVAPASRAARPGLRASVGPANGAGRARSFRVDAMLRQGGRAWLRRRWVNASGGRSVLPWKTVRTEAPRIVSATKP